MGRIIACLLILVMLLVLVISGCSVESPADIVPDTGLETIESETSEPETTVPETLEIKTAGPETTGNEINGNGTQGPVRNYTYSIANTYPHDKDAFTQGLVFENGVLYEGTGLYGRSTLRRVELETGNITRIHGLPGEYFGEGITVFKDTIIQLTWLSKKGFVYDKSTFQLLHDFTYETEGWGITHDGQRLIMSDGTATLYFLDPDTYQVTGHIDVNDEGVPVHRLNELEYINGRVYANVWQTDNIAIIDPASGKVTGWINLSGLLPTQSGNGRVDVLNGIAYDAAGGRLFVTGKLWPLLFEIELDVR